MQNEIALLGCLSVTLCRTKDLRAGDLMEQKGFYKQTETGNNWTARDQNERTIMRKDRKIGGATLITRLTRTREAGT